MLHVSGVQASSAAISFVNSSYVRKNDRNIYIFLILKQMMRVHYTLMNSLKLSTPCKRKKKIRSYENRKLQHFVCIQGKIKVKIDVVHVPV